MIWTGEEITEAVSELQNSVEGRRIRGLLTEFQNRRSILTKRPILEAMVADARRRLHESRGAAREWFRGIADWLDFQWESSKDLDGRESDFDSDCQMLILIEHMINQNLTANGAYHVWAFNPDRCFRSSAPAISNISGWDDERLLSRLSEVEATIGCTDASERVVKWWQSFREDRSFQRGLVLRVAEELALRSTTITEFFRAYESSNTANIQANLDYTDYRRLKRRFLKPLPSGLPPMDPWASLMEQRYQPGQFETSDLSEAQIRGEYEALRMGIGWLDDDATIAKASASIGMEPWEPTSLRSEWAALEAQAAGHPEYLVRLVESLKRHSMSWHQFVSCSANADTKDIQARLHYALYVRLKAENDAKLR